jgi:hypothetical protein
LHHCGVAHHAHVCTRPSPIPRSRSGANAIERAHIDAIGELLADVKTKINAGKDDESKEVAITFLTKACGYISNYLAAAGSGYTVGSTLSLADVQVRLKRCLLTFVLCFTSCMA